MQTALEANDLPHDLEAEQVLLGFLLADHPAIDLIAGTVEDDDFADPAHKIIFRKMEEKYRRYGGTPLGSIYREVVADPAMADLGCAERYLKDLLANAMTIIDPLHYARYIAELSRRRRLILLSRNFATEAHQTDRPVTTQIAELEAELADIQSRGGSDAVTVGDALKSALSGFEAAYTGGGQIQGVATGFAELDAAIGGLQPGNLYILAARPGMGKTALACQVATNAARQGHTAAIFSLEMPIEQIAGRIACAEARVPHFAAQRGTIEAHHFNRLAETSDQINAMPLHIDETPSISPGYMRGQCQQIKRKHGLGLVVVDYLQLMEADKERRGSNRTQEITDISNGLKTLAKALRVPVIALSQLNRGVENRDNKRPVLADLRESGAIEQDADAVIFIYREEYSLRHAEPDATSHEFDAWADAMEAAKGKAEIDIAKHRHGEPKTVRLKFNGPLIRFDDLPTDVRPLGVEF